MPQLDNITLCLTIGKRPEELRQTLTSLLERVPFQHIIAINDFGDEATNQVFKQLNPNSKLISLGKNLGHHRAVDEMYRHITTPYVFHCEDDWLFDTPIDIANLIAMLEADERLSSICLRRINDMNFTHEEQAKFQTHSTAYGDWISLAAVHDQWYGYTFNPHIAKIDTYRSLAPFAQFKKERHISRTFRKMGKTVGFLPQGACGHIGFDSVSNAPKPNLFTRIKQAFR